MVEIGDEVKKVVAVGSDHAGYRLKEELKPVLEDLGFGVVDLGTSSEEPCDYPDFAEPVAELVGSGKADRGLLVCGTGAGMAMVANKVRGVRAATCNDLFTAEHVRLHNDANIITLGARVIDGSTAEEALRRFMETGFEGGREPRHARRLDKLAGVERRHMEEC